VYVSVTSDDCNGSDDVSADGGGHLVLGIVVWRPDCILAGISASTSVPLQRVQSAAADSCTVWIVGDITSVHLSLPVKN